MKRLTVKTKKKKTSSKSARTPRTRIIEAALNVFSAHGAGASSIQDVADEAGVSKQALMHHFKNKDLLRDGVYEVLAGKLREQFPEAAGELISRSHDRYRKLLELVLHRIGEQRQLSRFLVYELLERPDFVLSWLGDEAAPWLGLVRGVVAQSPKNRTFDADAHVAVIGALMLAQSALIPASEKKWRVRTEEATLRVMVLGSHLG